MISHPFRIGFVQCLENILPWFLSFNGPLIGNKIIVIVIVQVNPVIVEYTVRLQNFSNNPRILFVLLMWTKCEMFCSLRKHIISKARILFDFWIWFLQLKSKFYKYIYCR